MQVMAAEKGTLRSSAIALHGMMATCTKPGGLKLVISSIAAEKGTLRSPVIALHGMMAICTSRLN